MLTTSVEEAQRFFGYLTDQEKKMMVVSSRSGLPYDTGYHDGINNKPWNCNFRLAYTVYNYMLGYLDGQGDGQILTNND